MQFLENFQKQTQLIQNFREDGAYLALVMGIYLGRNDIFELANNSLTDGKSDKK
nr:hypothetical protein [uncultured Lachnoclostridium sp.]